MIGKFVVLCCVQSFLAQCITSQCIGTTYNGLGLDGIGLPWAGAPYASPWNAGLPYVAEVSMVAPVIGEGCGPAIFAAATGGSFPVTSFSATPVTGVSMTSENVYEGLLSVSGAMPFLGAVALEGLLPTVGSGAVNYGCGNGNVAILSEDIAAGIDGYGAYGYGPAVAAAEYAYGYGAPMAYEAAYGAPYGINRGCGAFY